MLRNNYHLTDLSLQGNAIGDAGALALAKSLKVKGTLTSLDISGNKLIQRKTIKALDALVTNLVHD